MGQIPDLKRDSGKMPSRTRSFRYRGRAFRAKITTAFLFGTASACRTGVPIQLKYMILLIVAFAIDMVYNDEANEGAGDCLDVM